MWKNKLGNKIAYTAWSIRGPRAPRSEPLPAAPSSDTPALCSSLGPHPRASPPQPDLAPPPWRPSPTPLLGSIEQINAKGLNMDIIYKAM